MSNEDDRKTFDEQSEENETEAPKTASKAVKGKPSRASGGKRKDTSEESGDVKLKDGRIKRKLPSGIIAII